MDPSSLDLAFGAVLLSFAAAGIALRLVGARAAVLAIALAPLAALVAYEALVRRVMPNADIRVDWLLLFPIAIVHALHASARWRRLGAAAVD
jgi:hypothetical protein